MASNEEYHCTLSKEVQAKAKKELNEDPKTRQKKIDQLRAEIAKYPGLKACTDAGFLLRFLRARKFDLTRAYDLLVNYYAVRNTYPELLSDMKPSTVKMCIELGNTHILPGRCEDGSRVLLFRPGLWDPRTSDIKITDLLRMNLLSVEQLLKEDEEVQIHGIQFCLDASNVGRYHALEIAKGWPGVMISIFQDALPMRLKGIHYINEPTIMSYIFSFIKPFLKEKTKQRLHFHGHDLSDLQKTIPKDILPETYGGEKPPLPYQDGYDRLLALEDYFEDMNKYHLDDPKRLFDKPKGVDPQATGVEGTFKKLEID